MADFRGRDMHPNEATWSYGLVTMVALHAPTIMDSMAGGRILGKAKTNLNRLRPMLS